MQAVQKTAPNFGLELREVPEPSAPAAGEVLIDVAAVGICGSDLHIYEWTPGYEFVGPAMPVTLGHEFAGRVAALGSGVGADLCRLPSRADQRRGPRDSGVPYRSRERDVRPCVEHL